MKKILLYSTLIIFACCLQVSGIIGQTINIKTKGKISANSENEDNEPDPPFKPMLIPVGPKKVGAGQKVSELEHGLKIVQDIVDKMIEREYGFSLMSSHKYMVNNCLGIKVSAGEFKVKFRNPSITLSNTGKFTIKLGMNKIHLSALKIRMRPCTKPEHVLEGCHFGKKFEIGGDANDVTVTLDIDLVARAMDGSSGICFLAMDDNVAIKWKIGDVNLKPLQNNLDYLGKEMLEDGLNAGLFNVLFTQFVKISKDIIPKYYKECEGAYDIKKKMDGLPTQAVGANASSSTETEQWVITPVPGMKGVLGRLNIEYPGVERNILIYRQSDNSYLTSVSRNDKTFSYAPGEYRFELSSVPVDKVPIQKGYETRIKSGYLDIVSEGVWQLYDESKEKSHTSGNKPKKLPLPVGSYQLKLGGQFYPVLIKDGETVEL